MQEITVDEKMDERKSDSTDSIATSVQKGTQKGFKKEIGKADKSHLEKIKRKIRVKKKLVN